MSAAPAQKDKTSTTARVALTSGPAAAAVEPRKNKYKKFIKAIESNNTTASEPVILDTFEPMQSAPTRAEDTEWVLHTPTDMSMSPSTTSSPDQTASLLFEDSHPQQTSPTPTRKRAAKSKAPTMSPSDHDMQDDQPSVKPRRNQTALPRPPLTASRSDGDITITRAPRPTTGRDTSIHDRIIAAQERNALNHSANNAPYDPLNKYTKGEMPVVHDTDPTAPLKFIDINLVIEWGNYAKGKLIAIPFGPDADRIKNHDSIGEKLLTAAAEITKSDDLGISPPTPSDEAVLHKKTPTSFLIYNLSADEINILTQRRVWSSQAITFRVTNLHPNQPDFLFAIKNIKSKDDESILKMVEATWKSHSAQIIEDATETLDEELRDEARANIQSFLDSVYIKRLAFKIKGDTDVPRFNIYANGQLILEDDTWFYLREALASLPYTSLMLGRGQTVISPFSCAICHGVDHPTGMCTFPNQKGWNGPTPESVAKSIQNGDKPNRGTRGSRQQRL